MSTPVLILSDAPTAPTGLGRIANDLAGLIHANMGDVFRVGTFGCGAPVSRHLPWPQYTISRIENYVTPELPVIWRDFAGTEEKGIILAIWNPSWLWWLAQPGKLPPSDIKTFLEADLFKKWLYAPIDGDCGDGSLPADISEVLCGFDRLLGYTAYGSGVMARTMLKCEPGNRQVEIPPHLPHGLDTTVFQRHSRDIARKVFMKAVYGGAVPAAINENVTLLGCVATNSARKDWYLAFETCFHLKQKGVNVGLWAHTDSFRRYWDLHQLAAEFDMADRTIFTNHELTKQELSIAYSACNVTLGIGSGEGWGYPLAESLACGVPVIHGDYAGGAEFVPDEFRIEPTGYRGEGLFGIRRPVFNALEWADRIIAVKGRVTSLPEYIDWANAWPAWEKWLREGLNDTHP